MKRSKTRENVVAGAIKQRIRRLKIYRAAYEEVAADDQITEKERRAMQSLSRTLKLSLDEIKFVETEVTREREAITQTGAQTGVTGA